MVPSCCFYADDIMIYYTSRKSNLQNLKSLFTRYVMASGQCVSPDKSTIFYGAISHARRIRLAQSIGFSLGFMPFMYLGVLVFKGRPKKIHFQSIVDRINCRLTSWKVVLLSFPDRAWLIMYVIHSMIIYSIITYSWPSFLLKELEMWFKNLCGLQILTRRKFSQFPGVMFVDLKLCQDFMHSKNSWALILSDRVLRGSGCFKHHISSSH